MSSSANETSTLRRKAQIVPSFDINYAMELKSQKCRRETIAADSVSAHKSNLSHITSVVYSIPIDSLPDRKIPERRYVAIIIDKMGSNNNTATGTAGTTRMPTNNGTVVEILILQGT